MHRGIVASIGRLNTSGLPVHLDGVRLEHRRGDVDFDEFAQTGLRPLLQFTEC